MLLLFVIPKPLIIKRGFWGNAGDYVVSLLKAWWGEVATADNADVDAAGLGEAAGPGDGVSGRVDDGAGRQRQVEADRTNRFVARCRGGVRG